MTLPRQKINYINVWFIRNEAHDSQICCQSYKELQPYWFLRDDYEYYRVWNTRFRKLYPLEQSQVKNKQNKYGVTKSLMSNQPLFNVRLSRLNFSLDILLFSTIIEEGHNFDTPRQLDYPE